VNNKASVSPIVFNTMNRKWLGPRQKPLKGFQATRSHICVNGYSSDANVFTLKTREACAHAQEMQEFRLTSLRVRNYLK